MKKMNTFLLGVFVLLISFNTAKSQLTLICTYDSIIYQTTGTFTQSQTQSGVCTESYVYTVDSQKSLVLAFSSVTIDCTNTNNNLRLIDNTGKTYTYCGGPATSNSFNFDTSSSSYIAIQKFGIVSFSLSIQIIPYYKLICGIPAIQPSNGEDNTKIVGGTTAIKNSWPWQVYFTNRYYSCGASLINDQWIVTAAHCNFRSTLYATLAEHDRYSLDGQTRYKVTKFIQHPTYATNSAYDIALGKLETPVTFTNQIIPVCLPEGKATNVGQTATVTGWGLTTENGNTARFLQQVTIAIQAASVCNSDATTDICAGDFASVIHDSCQGDSGGPLVQKDSTTNRYYLAGIVSRGVGCRGRGIYTRVTLVEDWIAQTIAAN